MTVVAIILGTVLLATVICLVLITRLLVEDQREAQAEWALERRELLNRIQHPEFVPTTPRSLSLPEQEPDEWNLVGTIAPPPENE